MLIRLGSPGITDPRSRSRASIPVRATSRAGIHMNFGNALVAAQGLTGGRAHRPSPARAMAELPALQRQFGLSLQGGQKQHGTFQGRLGQLGHP
ncbi:hypothetical protein [Mycobacterium sp. 852002-40037_SCH5390672]|uniref:hypothetical protein n=1 Tax=Mycobacterium sp. 852002-40037_SCH5390672 TaxID=1834089 RepID=UPI0018D2983C|nr:hypothetical protein [Mycobacterium sp. 852002-40037_SCH5390672]